MELTTAARPPALQFFLQDTHSLDDLLSRYSPVMYRAALRKLGNVEDAEDALQEALLSASRNLGQFKGQCHISSWLVAIAINSARMLLRRRCRHRTVSLDQTSENGDSSLVYEPADERPDPEQIYRKVELHEIISQLAIQLSPPLRKAFRLRVLEGLSIQEAAQALGVTTGTLKAQLFRARLRIHTLMRGAGRPERNGQRRGKTRRPQHASHDRARERVSPRISRETRCRQTLL
jgi:RNA polymerase sigma-70 factor, ECF subfamily